VELEGRYDQFHGYPSTVSTLCMFESFEIGWEINFIMLSLSIKIRFS